MDRSGRGLGSNLRRGDLSVLLGTLGALDIIREGWSIVVWNDGSIRGRCGVRRVVERCVRGRATRCQDSPPLVTAVRDVVVAVAMTVGAVDVGEVVRVDGGGGRVGVGREGRVERGRARAVATVQVMRVGDRDLSQASRT